MCFEGKGALGFSYDGPIVRFLGRKRRKAATGGSKSTWERGGGGQKRPCGP